ncbi:hypothetical protein [Haloarchaeobius sp. DFWS5]|uniref:hypothetical protein n=1 Tax=Haloarchaeobius sp. DFWS5 TaxID=3446114 RepID=UPI003EBEE171
MKRLSRPRVWVFVRESVIVRWLVAPMLLLGTFALLIGLAASPMPPAQVAEVSIYFVAIGSAVMFVGLSVEYVVKRLLESDDQREYY